MHLWKFVCRVLITSVVLVTAPVHAEPQIAVLQDAHSAQALDAQAKAADAVVTTFSLVDEVSADRKVHSQIEATLVDGTQPANDTSNVFVYLQTPEDATTPVMSEVGSEGQVGKGLAGIETSLTQETLVTSRQAAVKVAY